MNDLTEKGPYSFVASRTFSFLFITYSRIYVFRLVLRERFVTYDLSSFIPTSFFGIS